MKLIVFALFALSAFGQTLSTYPQASSSGGLGLPTYAQAGGTGSPNTQACIAGYPVVQYTASGQTQIYTCGATTANQYGIAPAIGQLGPSIDLSSGLFIDSSTSYYATYGITLYGDSITYGIGCTIAANCWASLFNTELNWSTNYYNQANSGDDAADMAYRVATTARPTDTGNYLYGSLIGTNDYLTYGSSVANQTAFTQYQAFSHAWLATSSTNRVLSNNSTYIVQGGTWTADGTFITGALVSSTSNNTLTDSTAYIGPCGCFYVPYYLYSSSTGTFSVTVDGVAMTDTITGNATLSSQILANAPIHVGTTTAGLARFAGISQGAHNIVLTTKSAGNVGIIGLLFPAVGRIRGASGPSVLMGGVLPDGGNANASASTAYNTWSAAVATTLINDGLNVRFVNVRNAVDYNLDFLSSANQNCPASTNAPVHPNDCGHRHIANAFEDAAKTIKSSNTSSSLPISVGTPSSPPNITGFSNVNSANLGQSSTLNQGILFFSGTNYYFGAGLFYDSTDSLFTTELFAPVAQEIALGFLPTSPITNNSAMVHALTIKGSNKVVNVNYGLSTTNAPTISFTTSSGTCTISSITGGNGGGVFTMSSTGSCTPTLTWSGSTSYANGSVCGHLVNRRSGLVSEQTGDSTTTAIFALLSVISGDVVQYGPCLGY